MDVVGMLIVLECIVVRYCGMKVVGIFVIINLVVGIVDYEIMYEDMMENVDLVFDNFSIMMRKFLLCIGVK